MQIKEEEEEEAFRKKRWLSCHLQRSAMHLLLYFSQVVSVDCISVCIDGSHLVVVCICLGGLLIPFEFLKSLFCKSICVLGLAPDYRISRDYRVCLMSSPSFLSDLRTEKCAH